MPDGEVPVRRAVALIGNGVALALLGLLLLRGPLLFGEGSARAVERAAEASGASGSGESFDTVVAPGGEGAARTVRAVEGAGRSAVGATGVDDDRSLLLIVVDALRDDTSRDAALMPELAALAERGTRGTWWVDLLVPSTIGALETIVEGRSPPPVRVLQDFGARAADEGGWLQTLAERGDGTFVAGPDLWIERYGAWIDGAHAEAGMPDTASDTRSTRAGLAALASGAARVVVVHLGELDAVAHRHGAAGGAWRAAARRADERLGSLVDAAGDERAIVVLADHGVTRNGGHAGGEAAVRRAPLVVAAAPSAERELSAADGEGRLVRPDAVIRAALALDPEAATGERPPSSEEGDTTDTGRAAGPVGSARGGLAVDVLSAAALGAALVAIGAAAPLARSFAPGFTASAALWVAVASTAAGGASLGAGVATAVLAGLAALGWRRRTGVGARTVHRPTELASGFAGAVLVALSGAALATMAVVVADASADTAFFVRERTALPAFVPPLGAAAAGIAGGAWVARLDAPRVAGAALAFVIVACVHLGGESASLSSVDVRAAHRAAGLVPGAAGVALATPVALLRLLWPLAAVLGGYLIARRWRDDEDDGTARIRFAAAFGTCQLGAALVYATCLTRAVEPDLLDGLPLAAAGLGGLLRELVTAAVVFATLALAAPATGSRAAGGSPRGPA